MHLCNAWMDFSMVSSAELVSSQPPVAKGGPGPATFTSTLPACASTGNAQAVQAATATVAQISHGAGTASPGISGHRQQQQTKGSTGPDVGPQGLYVLKGTALQQC
mmetsp:Transcript_67189/g.216762  ORF Transcript_67189/g.216762 Transcript_67189/m.216762 type:complete len:106 (+) Transcript_67189:719-1036(+)